MAKKVFGNFYKIVCSPKDTLRTQLHYAIVQDGKVIATDGNVMVFTSLAAWVGKEQAELAEGKAFHYDLLVKMAASKWKSIRLTERGVNFYKSAIGTGEPDEFEFYSAQLHEPSKDLQVFQNINKLGELMQFKAEVYNEELKVRQEELVDATFKYPNWSAVIPQDYSKNNSYNQVGLNFEFLAKIGECFVQSSDGSNPTLRLEFSSATPDDKAHCTSRGIRVTPAKKDYCFTRDGIEEVGLIMPVMI